MQYRTKLIEVRDDQKRPAILTAMFWAFILGAFFSVVEYGWDLTDLNWGFITREEFALRHGGITQVEAPREEKLIVEADGSVWLATKLNHVTVVAGYPRLAAK